MKKENEIKNLRQCGFDPMASMITITYEEQNKNELYLEVKSRQQWFLQYCEENSIDGVIDDSDICYIPEAAMWVATASVFMNGALAGKSSAGVSATDPAKAHIAVQTACTFAKGRALAACGFNTFGASYTPEDGDAFPCDGGIVISGGQVIRDPFNPMMVQFQRDDNDETAAPPKVAPRATQKAEITYEDALKFVLPFGSMKGKTLSEVLGEKPSQISFYASDAFAGNGTGAEVKRMSQIILANRQ